MAKRLPAPGEKKETWSISVIKGPSGALDWNLFLQDIPKPKSMKDRLLVEVRRRKRTHMTRCAACGQLFSGEHACAAIVAVR